MAMKILSGLDASMFHTAEDESRTICTTRIKLVLENGDVFNVYEDESGGLRVYVDGRLIIRPNAANSVILEMCK